MKDGISIVIPTWNGGEIFRKNLYAVKNQKFNKKVELIIIDSGSSDGTPEAAEEAGAIVIRIDQKDFHHSRTRNLAVSHAQYDEVVLLVQDAIPYSNHWLDDLTNAITDTNVVAAYGKQIPHDDADVYARFEVDYHGEYLGDERRIQSLNSPNQFMAMSYEEALRCVRFDNVCAIYKKDMLSRFPFPDIAFGEDMAWAKEVILKGHKVVFDPSIQVKHSHNRPPDYRFRRAIVDALACSEILGKTKNNLSFLKEADLFTISRSIDQCKNKISAELMDSHTTRDLTKNYRIKYISRKFPITKKLIRFFLMQLGKNGKTESWIKGFSQLAEGHMRFVISELQRRYPESKATELAAGLEQTSASIEGGLFGEVMASYKLKGHVPRDIEDIITPYLRGV